MKSPTPTAIKSRSYDIDVEEEGAIGEGGAILNWGPENKVDRQQDSLNIEGRKGWTGENSVA